MPDLNINTHLCNAKNSCLVIIDMQTRLTSVMPFKVLSRLKRNINILLQSATKLSIPLLVTEQYPKGLGVTEPELEESLGKQAMKFEKTCFSCTDAPGFLQQLRETEVTQVILVGIEAHICVLQTAIQLIAKDYQVFVAADSVCSRYRDNYEVALMRMRNAGVVVTNTESILFEWLRDSTHEHFKEISKLL